MRSRDAHAAAAKASAAEAIGHLRRFARGHRRLLLAGGAATIGVVAMRLALPWPLKGFIEIAFPGQGASRTAGAAAPAVTESLLILCVAYVALAVGTGVFELIQRLWLSRFAAQTVHDMRAAAVAGLQPARPGVDTPASDRIARIIGDSARLKNDLKGILIHVSQDGLLALAVTGLFLVLAPVLGLLFLLGACLAVLIGYLTVEDVAEHSRRQRGKESEFAAFLDEAGDPEPGWPEADAVNRSSARRDVRTTRIIWTSGIFIHTAVAIVISVALWLGVRSVLAGDLAPGVLFLFIAYALMIHRRAVRVGRQIARFGKLLACAERLGALIATTDRAGASTLRLAGAITLREIEAGAAPHVRGRRRLGPVDLEIRRGERVAVLGPVGSGKTTLLKVLSGWERPAAGAMSWDGEDVTSRQEELIRSVELVSQRPTLPGGTVGRLIGVEPEDGADAGAERALRAIGAGRIVRRFRRGLAQSLNGGELSHGERRALRLAALLRSRAEVWALDDPLDSTGRDGRARLKALLEIAGERTVIVSLRRRCELERFDRVVHLKNGRVRFCGTPAEWQDWRHRRKAAKAGGTGGGLDLMTGTGPE